MRTVSLVIADLCCYDGEEELAQRPALASGLTHHEAGAGMLWRFAIRHTAVHGEVEVRRGRDLVALAVPRTRTERSR
jgi:hypothetical protein